MIVINLFISFSSQNEFQSMDKEEIVVQKISDNKSDNETKGEQPVLFKTLAEHLDEKQKEILRKEYDEQGNRIYFLRTKLFLFIRFLFTIVRLFNTKMQQILNDIKSLSVDESCSHTEKESVISMTSIEFNSSIDQDEQVETTDTTSSLSPSELFYDIQAKNFGADKV